jgi:hemoglobin-like flavoprotein
MGHQSQDSGNDLRVVEAIPNEKEKPTHPFLEKNDVTLLSVINPLLSSNGQKIVSFFVNFANNEDPSSFNLSNYFNQISNKTRGQTGDLLPSLIGLLSNPEAKNSLNPALLTTLFSMLNTAKKEE